MKTVATLVFRVMGLGLLMAAPAAFGLSYLWSKGTETYAPISGTSLTLTQADNGYQYVALPFNFTYDSVTYSSVYVSTNGVLGFNNTGTSTLNGNLFNTSSPMGVLAPWWDDLIDDDSSTVDYLISGSYPNQVLTVQYTNYPSYVTTPRSRLNFQVKLFETSNRIQFHYGPQIGATNADSATSASIGIKDFYTGPRLFIEGTTGSRVTGLPNLHASTDFPAPNTVLAFGPDTLAPQGLTAKPGNAQVTLTWNASKLSPLVRYRIYQGTTAANLVLRDSTATAIDTTFTVNGLINNTLYYFGVKAVGAAGFESEFSTIVSATPSQPPTVVITNPAVNGALIPAFAYTNLTATATDADGTVSRVEYYLGTTYLGVSYTSGTWAYAWYPSTTGDFVLTARAYDNSNAVTQSLPISIRVRSAPSVYLTSPTTGIYPAGTQVGLAATATQSGGTVARVEFYANAVKIGEDSTSPYTFTWVPTTPGRYSLTAVATNGDGLKTTSGIVSVGIGAIPSVTLVTPADSAVLGYPGAVSVSATLSDPDSLAARIDFYADGVFLSSVYKPGPYSLTWTPTSQGAHVLVARAIDYLNLIRNPDTAHVTLITGPTIRLDAPAHFSAVTTGSNIQIAATVTGQLATVSEVRFYRDTVLIGSDNAAPYQMTWTNPPVGRHRIQARAVDILGGVGYSQTHTVFVNDSGKALPGGRLLVTGHDADDHRRFDFMAVGIDYLVFGRAPYPSEVAISKGCRIAYLGSYDPVIPILGNYSAPVFIDPSLAKWDSLLFDNGRFDAIIVGTGLDYLSKVASDSLNAKKARFEKYFNQGGGIFALSEQGIGQSFYNFLPAFGSAKQQSISAQGQFTLTSQGQAVGWTSAMVNSDPTHTEFVDIDSGFQIFERYNLDSLPVTIGVNAHIENGGFIPIDTVVEPPEALAKDTVFDDTLCIRFVSGTPGATLHLTTDGGDPDSSKWMLANGAAVCIDRNTAFRVVAKKPGWIPSAERKFTYRKLNQVLTPVPDIADSYFEQNLCVTFTSATDGAILHYTLDGSVPDSTSAAIANGSKICLTQSDTVKIMGLKPGMLASNVGIHAYQKMQQVAPPYLIDKSQQVLGDTAFFRDTLCIAFKDSTVGAHILYTLDGTLPDSSEMHVHDGNMRCFTETTPIRMIATLGNWISSPRVRYQLVKRLQVAAPIPNRDDSLYFADTLCAQWNSATDSSSLRYTLDGGSPDTSGLNMPNRQNLCVDRTVDIRVQAVRDRWDPSSVVRRRFFKMDTVGRVQAEPTDSTYFTQSLCIRLASNTEASQVVGQIVRGDSTRLAFAKPSGDTVCIDSDARIVAHAEKTHWVPSPSSSFRYFMRRKAEAPVADKSDSLYFADSICIRLTSPSSGVRIRYVVDGSRVDSAASSLENGGRVCGDSTLHVRAIAVGPDWLPSDTTRRDMYRMSKLAPPKADPKDSTYFKDSLCVAWSHAEPGVDIWVAKDASGLSVQPKRMRSGDTLCFEASTVLYAKAEKQNWVTSAIAVGHYFRKQVLDAPEFDVKDTVFYPTLCAELRHANADADLHYTVDGGNPDTAQAIKHAGDTVCVSRTADIKVLARQENAIDSKVASVHLEKMKKITDIRSNRGDSLVFAGKLCFALTSSTEGVRIAYAINGDRLDASSPVLANGDTVCIDRTVEVRAVATKADWLNSDTAVFVYTVDNTGPYVVKAERRDFQFGNLSISGNCRGVGLDTLKLTLSEKIRAKSKPPRWDKLAIFSTRCDPSSASPVPTLNPPTLAADSLHVLYYFNADPSVETPQGGHCVYLDAQAGEFTDAVGNAPDKRGARVEVGTQIVRISNLRAYPPVVGLDDMPSSRGCVDERHEDKTWIEPVGFDPATGTVDAQVEQTCGEARQEGNAGPKPIPPCMSVVEVVSNGGYVADVQIFDNFGNFVRSSRQTFGHCGELENTNRSEKGKIRSYLVWNTRDRSGARVGTGAYLWRIEFKADASKPGQTRTAVMRTGFMRTETCK